MPASISVYEVLLLTVTFEVIGTYQMIGLMPELGPSEMPGRGGGAKPLNCLTFWTVPASMSARSPVMKSLSITVYGSNFSNGLGIVLSDQDGKEQTIFMDYLQFDGWRTLTWNNPNYIGDVRNRELRKYPLYPKGMPYLKLNGIILFRDAAQEGGDFVTYVKDIKVTYDKAIMSVDRDINDEAIWGILQARNESKRLAELKRLGNIQVLRFLEKAKMHVDKTNQ